MKLHGLWRKYPHKLQYWNSELSAGPFEDALVNLAYSMDFACPELCRISSLQAPASGCFNAMAHDVWGLGYLLFWLLTGRTYFAEDTWEAMCNKHDEWVSCPRSLLCRPVNGSQYAHFFAYARGNVTTHAQFVMRMYGMK